MAVEMLADQAIFTSMHRRGRSGYHLVARSSGVVESEAQVIEGWSPSHGELIVDDTNRSSVSIFPLPSGRIAISRTREGRAEYSGRGGSQLFTRAVIIDTEQLRSADFHPFEIYRDAFALGYLAFDPEPPVVLERVELSSLYSGNAPAVAQLVPAPQSDILRNVPEQLVAGRAQVVSYSGDRLRLAEILLSGLPPDVTRKISVSTSLHASSVRPFLLALVAPS